MDAYDLDDFRAALSVQYLFWALGIVQILRYRAPRPRPPAPRPPRRVESMRRGEPFVHPGFSDREGV